VNPSSNPLTIVGALGTMEMHLLNPPLDSVSIVTQPFDNGTFEPNSTLLRVARTAVNPQFSFLLIPRENAAPAPAVTRQGYPWGYACRVDWGGGMVDHLVRNDSGGPVTHGHIETDGLVTLVRENTGVVYGYLAAGVSSLVVGRRLDIAGTVTANVVRPST
jgi:hypothetical protein